MSYHRNFILAALTLAMIKFIAAGYLLWKAIELNNEGPVANASIVLLLCIAATVALSMAMMTIAVCYNQYRIRKAEERQHRRF